MLKTQWFKIIRLIIVIEMSCRLQELEHLIQMSLKEVSLSFSSSLLSPFVIRNAPFEISFQLCKKFSFSVYQKTVRGRELFAFLATKSPLTRNLAIES